LSNVSVGERTGYKHVKMEDTVISLLYQYDGAHKRREEPAPLLKLVTRWRSVASYMLRPIYLRRKTTLFRYSLDRRMGGRGHGQKSDCIHTDSLRKGLQDFSRYYESIQGNLGSLRKYNNNNIAQVRSYMCLSDRRNI
jgi:hypothetical protein